MILDDTTIEACLAALRQQERSFEGARFTRARRCFVLALAHQAECELASELADEPSQACTRVSLTQPSDFFPKRRST
jgi:hypothetical protein